MAMFNSFLYVSQRLILLMDTNGLIVNMYREPSVLFVFEASFFQETDRSRKMIADRSSPTCPLNRRKGTYQSIWKLQVVYTPGSILYNIYIYIYILYILLYILYIIYSIYYIYTDGPKMVQMLVAPLHFLYMHQRF